MERVRYKTNRLRVALFNYVDSSRLYCVKLNLLSNRCRYTTLHNYHCQGSVSHKTNQLHKYHCVYFVTLLQICFVKWQLYHVANMSHSPKNDPLRGKMTPLRGKVPTWELICLTPTWEYDLMIRIEENNMAIALYNFRIERAEEIIRLLKLVVENNNV